jgi:hypothetical protein
VSVKAFLRATFLVTVGADQCVLAVADRALCATHVAALGAFMLVSLRKPFHTGFTEIFVNAFETAEAHNGVDVTNGISGSMFSVFETVVQEESFFPHIGTDVDWETRFGGTKHDNLLLDNLFKKG